MRDDMRKPGVEPGRVAPQDPKSNKGRVLRGGATRAHSNRSGSLGAHGPVRVPSSQVGSHSAPHGGIRPMTALASDERRAYLRKYQRGWLNRRRAEWIAANGPCKKCGSSERLEVDHIDPAQKITHAVWSWSKVRREAELAKCQVLCYTCHKAKTSSDRPAAKCGTRSRYVAGCRCADCRFANRVYSPPIHRRAVGQHA